MKAEYLVFAKEVEQLIVQNMSGGANSLRKDSLERLAEKHGIQDQTEVKELAEYAIVQMARSIGTKLGLNAKQRYEQIVNLYNHQPNLTHRSSQSTIYQQYSTPAPISYIGGAWCLLGSHKGAIMLEPSAGNGLFTIAFDPALCVVNEIDNFRSGILKQQGFNNVLNMDASIPSNFKSSYGNFDIVCSNPPFDKLQKDITFNGTEFGVLDHIMAAIALECLKPNGRAAIIVGGHTEYDEQGRVKAGKNRKFVNYLYKHYNVTDIININGKLYSRQGTSFNIRLILIDGRKPAPSGFAPLLQDMEPMKRETVNTFDELYARVSAHTSWSPNQKKNNTEDMNELELEAEALILLQQQELELAKNTIGDIPEIKLSYEHNNYQPETIKSSDDANKVLRNFMEKEQIQLREKFFVVLCDRANNVLGVHEMSMGSKSATIVDPSVIVALAAKTNASGVILCHNHPSGNLKPSEPDLHLTIKAGQALALIDVRLLDHMILTAQAYYSFADEGLALKGLGGEYPKGYPKPSMVEDSTWYDKHYPKVEFKGKEYYQVSQKNVISDNVLIVSTKNMAKWSKSGSYNESRNYTLLVPVKALKPIAEIPINGVSKTRWYVKYWVGSIEDGKNPNYKIKYIPFSSKKAAHKYIDRETRYEKIHSRGGYDGYSSHYFVVPASEVDPSALGMPYLPASDSCNTLNVDVPDSMGFEIHDALNKMKLAVGGDVTEFVREKLQYSSKIELCKALAAEQIDAVATAIYNMEQKGQGIIIGDQTGIGKGRQAAAIVRYGIIQGLTPVFLTEKNSLFSDFYRDMLAIGSAHYKPFIVNAKESDTDVKDEEGHVVYTALEPRNQKKILENPKGGLKGFDYIMATYSQFNKNGVDKDTGVEKRDLKGLFLEYIADGNIIIMDESHNAGGDSNIGKYLANIVKMSKGTIFLSATFAKRPSNMPIYAIKTALQDCNMSAEKFIFAFDKGGVALQEVISAQLVQEGQMIRRERTIEDLKSEYVTLSQSELEHTAIADKITAIMRRIVKFEEDYIDQIIDEFDNIVSGEQGEAKKTKGTGKAGVSNSPYFSKLFNVINQMLFSIKAPEVAQETIRQLQQGKKVVIAFSSTMGAFLSDVEVGSIINADFGEVLERGLNNVLRYTETDADGKPTHKYIPLTTLSAEALAEYQDILKDIKVASTGITVSPIDVLTQTIKAAGYTVAEVTGRDKILQYKFTDAESKAIQDKQAAKPKKKGKADKLVLPPIPNCKAIIPPMQLATLMQNTKGEEGEHFIEMLIDIEERAEILKKRNVEKEAYDFKKNNPSSPKRYLMDIAVPSFHYMNGSSDIYIYGWDERDGLFYTYTILNGDTQMAEFGDQALSELFGNYGMGRSFELDLHFTPQPMSVILQSSKFSGLGKAAAATVANTMALVLAREEDNAETSFRKFQNNEVDVLMINQSGSTGKSAHAIPTEKVPKDKVKPRVMIFLQPELDINRQVQKMGRINRTGQILPPEYIYMTSVIPAEQRLMMMLQKKIKSLDANTSSNQKNSSNVIDVPDFLNKYGDKVVYDYLVSNPKINKLLGEPITIKEGEEEAKKSSKEKTNDLSHKVSGRVAILPVKDQQHFYTNVLEEYIKYTNMLKQQGKYDLELETKNFEALTIESSPIFINPNPGRSVFANHSYLEKVEINNLVKPYTEFEVRERLTKTLEGYENGRAYIDRLEKDYEAFAEKKEESIKVEWTKYYEERIQLITEEKGYKKLETNFDRNEYVSTRTRELERTQTEKIKSELKKFENQYNTIVSVFRFFIPGRSVLLPTATYEQGASFTPAICLGFDINFKKDNPYTPGNIYLSFALSDSNRHFDLNLANENGNLIFLCKGQSYDIKEDYLLNWTELCTRSNKSRVERYIITGNMLQTITMENYSNGKLVNYTVQGGGVAKGYIMPDKWQPNFQLDNADKGKAAIKVPVPVYMARQFIKDNVSIREPLSTDQSIIFGRDTDGDFVIKVPRSKTQGGSVFQDKELLKLVVGNNFNSKSNEMVAKVFDSKVDDVLRYLQDAHNLNILVSTEQLKQIDIPKGMAPTVQQPTPILQQPAAKLPAALQELIDANPNVQVVSMPKNEPVPGTDDEEYLLELEAEALIIIQMQELELLGKTPAPINANIYDPNKEVSFDAHYKGKKIQIMATSKYQAIKKAAAHFKAKEYDMNVIATGSQDFRFDGINKKSGKIGAVKKIKALKTTPEFKIFKQGVTKGWVTILSMEGEPFNKAEKMKKYKDLGYKVASLKK